MLSLCFLRFSVGVGAFVTGLGQSTSFSSHCPSPTVCVHVAYDPEVIVSWFDGIHS